MIDTENDEIHKTIILTVTSRAPEAASIVLDQTGIVQVSRKNKKTFKTENTI